MTTQTQTRTEEAATHLWMMADNPFASPAYVANFQALCAMHLTEAEVATAVLLARVWYERYAGDSWTPRADR